MKRFYALFFLCCVWAVNALAQLAPEFSTPEKPVYFRIQFTQGNVFLSDEGNGNLLKSQVALPVEAQKFQFIGTKDKCVLRSALGHYVTMQQGTAPDGRGGQFFAATTDAQKAVNFALKPQGKGYELAHLGIASNNYMNLFGGGGAGRVLGVWSFGDKNNAFLLKSGDTKVTMPDRYTGYHNVVRAMGEYPLAGVSTFAPKNPLTLWYPSPANAGSNPWMEYSLPIGNGQLGACIFGGVKTDEIQFNEKTLWWGTPKDMQRQSGDGPVSGFGSYLNFGGLFVQNLNANLSQVKDYVRYLDIETAVAGVKFTDQTGTQYTRRYLSSQPDGVIAALYEAEGANKLDLQFTLISGDTLKTKKTQYAADGSGWFAGKLPTVFHNARFKVVPVGGTMTATADGIVVKGANKVLVILAGGTSFDPTLPARTKGSAEDLNTRIATLVDNAAKKSFETIEAANIADHQSYMGRVAFHLEGAASQRNTKDLVDYYSAAPNNRNTPDGLFLEQLYFNFGRYLSISSSRGAMPVPNNLQGIWNNRHDAPWNSDVHNNINVQMNYWPAEPTNLSDCHLPFLNYIINNAQSEGWQRAARDFNKINGKPNKGWTVFTESNIFGGMSTWSSNYCVANAWLVYHLWQHYRYTLDREFLLRAWPAIWGSAEFWIHRLKKATDGTYEAPNEWSPEYGPTQDGVAHAQQLITENLQIAHDVVEILGAKTVGISDADLKLLNDRLTHLDKGLRIEKYRNDWAQNEARERGISKDTPLLKEWKYSDYRAGRDVNHRHLSHLMCLYPFSQVQEGDKGFYEAAKNSLALRGDDATGWSMGWKTNLWARAKDGNHARRILSNALKHAQATHVVMSGGGVYYNLWDAHPSFQIDGNFGVTAGVAEMLLQSQNEVIEILPALPSDWTAGSITGLKAVGNFTVDITWKGGKAAMVNITSHKGTALRVKGADLAKVSVMLNGKEVQPQLAAGINAKQQVYEIPGVKAGDKVVIDYTKPTAIGGVLVANSLKTASVASATAQVYDLSGRLAHASTQGILIAQGKKVIK